jgi:hypothetical protein
MLDMLAQPCGGSSSLCGEASRMNAAFQRRRIGETLALTGLDPPEACASKGLHGVGSSASVNRMSRSRRCSRLRIAPPPSRSCTLAAVTITTSSRPSVSAPPLPIRQIGGIAALVARGRRHAHTVINSSSQVWMPRHYFQTPTYLQLVDNPAIRVFARLQAALPIGLVLLALAMFLSRSVPTRAAAAVAAGAVMGSPALPEAVGVAGKVLLVAGLAGVGWLVFQRQIGASVDKPRGRNALWLN